MQLASVVWALAGFLVFALSNGPTLLLIDTLVLGNHERMMVLSAKCRQST